MQRILKLIGTLCAFAAIAYGVFLAGDLAMSDSPLLALIPVAVLLCSVVVYVRIKDK